MCPAPGGTETHDRDEDGGEGVTGVSPVASARNVVVGMRVRAHLHGTIFGDRPAAVGRLAVGDRLILVPDPPGTTPPGVWAHLAGGDVVGHLPVQIAAWLAPWMLEGGRVTATVTHVAGADVESWKRVEVEVDVYA